MKAFLGNTQSREGKEFVMEKLDRKALQNYIENNREDWDRNTYEWTEFLDFILRKSDRVQLSILLNETMIGESEIALATENKLKTIEKNIEELRSPERLERLLETYKGDQSIIHESTQYHIEELKKRAKKNDFKHAKIEKGYSHMDIIRNTIFEKAFINHWIDVENHASFGPMVRNFTFKLDESIVDCLKSLDNPYSRVIAQGVEFEDPAFFSGDVLIASICTHESTTYFNLEDSEVEGKLNASAQHNRPIEFIGFELTDEDNNNLYRLNSEGDLSVSQMIEFLIERCTRWGNVDGSVIVSVGDLIQYFEQ